MRQRRGQKLFPVAFPEMFYFSLSCFIVFLFHLTQLTRAAQKDLLPPPLAFGRIAIVYHSPLELNLLTASKDGNPEKVQEILDTSRPIDNVLLGKAIILACDTNKHAVVRVILAEQVLGIDVIQKVLLDAARKNSGETVTEILRSGAYDPADLMPTFSAALTYNSDSVVRAFLQFPKFSYPEANRARAIELCKAQKFTDMEKLLSTPRDQLLCPADTGTCIIF